MSKKSTANITVILAVNYLRGIERLALTIDTSDMKKLTKAYKKFYESNGG